MGLGRTIFTATLAFSLAACGGGGSSSGGGSGSGGGATPAGSLAIRARAAELCSLRGTSVTSRGRSNSSEEMVEGYEAYVRTNP